MARININPSIEDGICKKHGKIPSGDCYDYFSKDSVEKLVEQTLCTNKMRHDRFGVFGVPNTKDPKEIAIAFEFVQKYYNESIGRRMDQYIVLFNKNETKALGIVGVELVIYNYLYFKRQDYQYLYAIHEDDPERLHVHILVNPINYETGSRCRRNKSSARKEIRDLNKVIKIIIMDLSKV